ncbi:MAG: DUF1932 domain-containing protein [Dehalococcoidia bacterium]
MINTVAIMSPGDMGHSVGLELKNHGIDVITCLDGRSERTKLLASQGGFRVVETFDEMVVEADLLLSIMVPSNAKQFAIQVSKSIESTNSNLIFVDCNAISPENSKNISEIITKVGGKYVDGGIIGNSPANGDVPRFYVSGPFGDSVLMLDGKGIQVKLIGNEIGQASGIKMCYAALTKGTNTLQVALLILAEKMGLLDELVEEFSSSQSNVLNSMEKSIRRLPANAHRWIGEMQEIAATFEDFGMTSDFHKGAEKIYTLLNESQFGDETPETIDPDRTSFQTIKMISKNL